MARARTSESAALHRRQRSKHFERQLDPLAVGAVLVALDELGSVRQLLDVCRGDDVPLLVAPEEIQRGAARAPAS